MSDGKCGQHTYSGITPAKKDAILQALRNAGATITGSNPWEVDVHSHGVKLRGSWDAGTETLAIIVTDKAWYVPCSKIWETIDGLLRHIASLSDSAVPT